MRKNCLYTIVFYVVTLMHEIALFVEDYEHDSFIRALIIRYAAEYGYEIRITPYSAIGGYGAVIGDFSRYLRDLRNDEADYYDLLVVATDSNCKGYSERKKEISEKAEEFKHNLVCAIPDPHIERWMLLDQCAFKKTFGSCRFNSQVQLYWSKKEAS